jgi:dTDP-4-dehydrorhamnose reductase
MGYMGSRLAMIYTHILGATGMLGSMVTKTWQQGTFIPVSREAFNAEDPLYHWYKEGDWIINCIGVIKPYCDDIPRAIKVNALFPYTLPANTIQIATDCVYSGAKGNYVESDPHDADDIYGKTKSLGEATHIKNLRCSIALFHYWPRDKQPPVLNGLVFCTR